MGGGQGSTEKKLEILRNKLLWVKGVFTANNANSSASPKENRRAPADALQG